jgi:hypothetical protein
MNADPAATVTLFWVGADAEDARRSACAWFTLGEAQSALDAGVDYQVFTATLPVPAVLTRVLGACTVCGEALYVDSQGDVLHVGIVDPEGTSGYHFPVPPTRAEVVVIAVGSDVHRVALAGDEFGCVTCGASGDASGYLMTAEGAQEWHASL